MAKFTADGAHARMATDDEASTLVTALNFGGMLAATGLAVLMTALH